MRWTDINVICQNIGIRLAAMLYPVVGKAVIIADNWLHSVGIAHISVEMYITYWVGVCFVIMQYIYIWKCPKEIKLYGTKDAYIEWAVKSTEEQNKVAKRPGTDLRQKLSYRWNEINETGRAIKIIDIFFKSAVGMVIVTFAYSVMSTTRIMLKNIF